MAEPKDPLGAIGKALADPKAALLALVIRRQGTVHLSRGELDGDIPDLRFSPSADGGITISVRKGPRG
jgi:hypothetical protein